MSATLPYRSNCVDSSALGSVAFWGLVKVTTWLCAGRHLTYSACTLHDTPPGQVTNRLRAGRSGAQVERAQPSTQSPWYLSSDQQTELPTPGHTGFHARVLHRDRDRDRQSCRLAA